MRAALLAPLGRREGWHGLLLCLLLVAGGCSNARHSVAHVEVTGRVLYKNKPVTGGEVQFATLDGFSTNGVIDENGNYKVNAPVGDVKIAVNNQMLNDHGPKRGPAMRGAGRPDGAEPTPIKGTYVQIPPRYYKIDSTDLRYTVTNEPQTHDIELTD